MKDSRRDETQLTQFIYSFFKERFLFMNINISLVLAFKKKSKEFEHAVSAIINWPRL